MDYLTKALLLVALVYITNADIPYVEPGEGCVYGISVYNVGEEFNRGCDNCTCNADGEALFK